MISAVVMPEPLKPLELRAFDEPDLEPGGILLKTLGSEMCGTDTHPWKGQLAGVPYPIIPGHVSVIQVMTRYAKQFPWTGLISRECDLSNAQTALEEPRSASSPHVRRRPRR